MDLLATRQGPPSISFAERRRLPFPPSVLRNRASVRCRAPCLPSIIAAEFSSFPHHPCAAPQSSFLSSVILPPSPSIRVSPPKPPDLKFFSLFKVLGKASPFLLSQSSPRCRIINTRTGCFCVPFFFRFSKWDYPALGASLLIKAMDPFPHNAWGTASFSRVFFPPCPRDSGFFFLILLNRSPCDGETPPLLFSSRGFTNSPVYALNIGRRCSSVLFDQCPLFFKGA